MGSRIIIADRSELAGNLYRLLLAPLGAVLVVRKRFEEARPHFFRREGADLAIFNSNMFGKKGDEIEHRISEDAPLKKVKKIFLLKEGEAKGGLAARLSALPETHLVVRPFHPDEFKALVAGLLSR